MQQGDTGGDRSPSQANPVAEAPDRFGLGQLLAQVREINAKLVSRETSVGFRVFRDFCGALFGGLGGYIVARVVRPVADHLPGGSNSQYVAAGLGVVIAITFFLVLIEKLPAALAKKHSASRGSVPDGKLGEGSPSQAFRGTTQPKARLSFTPWFTRADSSGRYQMSHDDPQPEARSGSGMSEAEVKKVCTKRTIAALVILGFAGALAIIGIVAAEVVAWGESIVWGIYTGSAEAQAFLSVWPKPLYMFLLFMVYAFILGFQWVSTLRGWKKWTVFGEVCLVLALAIILIFLLGGMTELNDALFPYVLSPLLLPILHFLSWLRAPWRQNAELERLQADQRGLLEIRERCAKAVGITYEAEARTYYILETKRHEPGYHEPDGDLEDARQRILAHRNRWETLMRVANKATSVDDSLRKSAQEAQDQATACLVDANRRGVGLANSIIQSTESQLKDLRGRVNAIRQNKSVLTGPRLAELQRFTGPLVAELDKQLGQAEAKIDVANKEPELYAKLEAATAGHQVVVKLPDVTAEKERKAEEEVKRLLKIQLGEPMGR